MEHLGKHLEAARTIAASRQQREPQRETSGSSNRTDAEKRFAMLAKFFVFYPQIGSDEDKRLRLEAYYSELSDIHPTALGYAFRRMVRHEKREFLPKIHEIRRTVAYVIRAAQAGRDPGEPDPVNTPEQIDESRYLQLAPPQKPWAALCAGPRLLQAGGS